MDGLARPYRLSSPVGPDLADGPSWTRYGGQPPPRLRLGTAIPPCSRLHRFGCLGQIPVTHPSRGPLAYFYGKRAESRHVAAPQQIAFPHEPPDVFSLVACLDLDAGRGAWHRFDRPAGHGPERAGQRALDGRGGGLRLCRRLALSQRLADGQGADGGRDCAPRRPSCTRTAGTT